MQDDKTPKIFISYSWTRETEILELATRLMSHGVDVVLDKWDLKEGQDKDVFMERCVNDPDISRVLIICDREYTEKANNRTGGVGNETAIISPEIYGNVNQEKFIPIIAERDENGKPYVPAYIKSRIYIDLSNPETSGIYEAEYEKLLRNIYERPQFVKPNLGSRLEWLDEEKTDLFPLKDLLRQIKGSSVGKKRKACISRFQSAYIDALKGFYQKNASPDEIYNNYLNTKPNRDIFLEFLSVLGEEEDYAELLANFFEEMYNCLSCVRSFDEKANSASSEDFDGFKTLIWELFICTIAFMRHLKDYKAINTILTSTYFLIDNVFGGNVKPNNYTAFRFHSRVIEEDYKPQSQYKDKRTLVGEVVCNQRTYLPIYTKDALIETDLFLYQVCNAYTLAESDSRRAFPTFWFPNLYVYGNKAPSEWSRMKSKKFCEKMFILFGVKDIDELKQAVSRCTHERDMRYSGAFESALAILDCIKIDEIGILP